MTQQDSPIRYGDNLRLQPQLSKLVDRAVVKFVNKSNDESDDLKGFDDPLFHLPKPAELASKVSAFRRWHGADWWMILHEDNWRDSTGGVVTRRVTVSPDSREPDTLSITPDLVVTRREARFVLPEYKLNYREIRQQVSLIWIYRLLVLETSDNEHLDEVIVKLLFRAWEYTSGFNPDDATVFVS